MYFGMLDFGRVVPTSFMTASKATNRMRKNRKWIFDIRTGNGMIVQMEDESETNEDDMTLTVQWSKNR
jgi:hypothetical protein